MKARTPGFIGLGAAVVVGAFLATQRFLVVLASGLAWDTASFLTNGAVIAGLYHYGYDPTRPPLIPMILSAVFRVTGPSVLAGFVLSGLFYGLAVVGCYLVAGALLNRWLALLSSVSYGSIVNVVYWAGVGYSDVEGVAVASLGLGLTVYASRGHPRAYLCGIPLLGLAFLTRYTMGVVVPAAAVYLVMSRRKLTERDVEHIIGGCIMGVLVATAMGWQWYTAAKSPTQLFPAQHAGLPYLLDYLTSLPRELGNGPHGIVVTVLIGVAIGFLVFDLARKRANPLVAGLSVWFLFSVAYYVRFQSTPPEGNALRYSTEFAFPATILSFWAAETLVSRIFAALWVFKVRFFSADAQSLLKRGFFVLLILLVMPTTIQSLMAGASLNRVPGLSQTQLAGVQEAAVWLRENVTPGTVVTSDFFPPLQWYAPEFRVVYFGDSPRKDNATFSHHIARAAQKGVQYLVLVGRLPWQNSQLQFVWVCKNRSVSIYKLGELT